MQTAGLRPMDNISDKPRCPWCLGDDDYIAYHDRQWGVPVHDDQLLFEFLVLEGAQAGLSWLTILKKRSGYRQAFDGFDPRKVAGYDEGKIQSLLENKGIVRNRLKIRAAVENAAAFLKIQEEYGSFDDYIWAFVEGRPLVNNWSRIEQIPTRTPVSEKMSRELKRMGFKFVGPTICYAFMQAVGMVNDHLVSCFRHAELK